MSPRSGARTSSRIGTPRRHEHVLERRVARKRSTRARSAAGSTSSPRTAATTCSGNAEASAGDRAHGARGPAPARSAPSGRRRRRGPRSGTAPTSPTGGPTPSARPGSERVSRSTVEHRRALRSRSCARTRRRRTGAARSAAAAAAKCASSAASSSGKYGGAMTATASAPPAPRARRVRPCRRSSARRSGRRPGGGPGATPRRSARRLAGARRRESRIPSPFVPSASSPSSPPATRKSTTGPNPSSSIASPPSRSGVTEAARAPVSTRATLSARCGEVLVVLDLPVQLSAPAPSLGAERLDERPALVGHSGQVTRAVEVRRARRMRARRLR